MFDRVKSTWPFFFVALHLTRVALWFRKVDFSSDNPLVNVDYIQYYARVLRAHRFLSESGRIWGYDPFEGAGQISGPFLDVGTHFLSLLAHALSPWVAIGRTILAFEVAGFIAMPFFIYLGLKCFGRNRNEAWLGFGFSVLIFGYLDILSRIHIRVGLFGFMLASFLSFWQTGLFWAWCCDKRVRTWILMTLVSVLLPQIHPASIVVVWVPCLVSLVLWGPTFGKREFGLTFFSAGLVLAGNWYWLHPYLMFSDWMGTAPYFVTRGAVDLLKFFSSHFVDQGNPLRPLACAGLATAAIHSLVQLIRREFKLGVVFAAWGAFLVLVFCWGSQIPVLKGLQPGRNEFPFWLLMGALAGGSFAWILNLAGWKKFGFIFGCGAVAIFSVSASVTSNIGTVPFPSLTNTFPVDQSEAILYLQSKIFPNGRLLLECNDMLKPNFSDIIPLRTGQSLLGGPHPGNFLKTNNSVFKGAYVYGNQYNLSYFPRAFDQFLEELSEDQFKQQLDAYNVHGVAAERPQSKEVLDRFTSVLVPMVDMGNRRFYRVVNPSTWFFKGTGDVEFDLDRIVIKTPSQGRLFLKFHWLKTLKSNPVLPLRPVREGADPLPFIEVDNTIGTDTIVIENRGFAH